MSITKVWEKVKWWLLGGILFTGVVFLAMAPAEGTLGNGIKPVYVHVSLTWTGMLLFAFSTVLAVIGALTAKKAMSNWLRIIFGVAFGAYLGGFLVSILASLINWGGVPFREPRVLSAINVLVVAIGVGVLMRLVPWLWLSNLLGGVPIWFIVFSAQSSRMVLHPDNPVNDAPVEIRNTFLGMFVLAMFLAFWLIVFFKPQKAK